MRRKLLFILFFCGLNFISAVKIFAQADINLSMHWANKAYYNPAFIARPDYMYISGSVRSQWTSINGAPKVFNFQMSDYYHPLRSAFGLSLISDNVGFTSVVNPMLQYAYLLTNSENWSFSFGAAAGVYLRNVDVSKFHPKTPTDPALYDYENHSARPDANIGLEFQNKNFTIGASTTHLFSIANPDTLFSIINHRVGYFVYRNKINESIKFDVGVQVMNRQNVTVAEFNTMFRFSTVNGLKAGIRDAFEVGLSYRTSKIAALQAGIYVTPEFRVCYSYDHAFVKGYFTFSTHEIMLEYRIPMKSATSCETCEKHGWY